MPIAEYMNVIDLVWRLMTVHINV